MNLSFKKITVFIAIGGAATISLGILCYAVGARVNTSKSIPLGLYWTSDRPITKGSYVLFCPPQVGVIAEAKHRGYLISGFCPGDYGYMMKKISATKNDTVTISDAGVSVNGALLPFSAPIRLDGAGRTLPRYQAANFIIGNSELLLMSDVSGTSFDGRYFGPVNRSQIKTVIVPVITW
ncbi:MAG: conjugative transfer signal peptidase TraF [Pseudomonadota bacterium]